VLTNPYTSFIGSPDNPGHEFMKLYRSVETWVPWLDLGLFSQSS